MEQKFEPFQKVLARYNSAQFWSPCIYQERVDKVTHKVIGKQYPVEDVIAYEGNEELAYTFNKPLNEYKWGDKVEIYWTNQWRKALYGEKCKQTTGHNVYYCNACVHAEDNEIRPLKEEKND